MTCWPTMSMSSPCERVLFRPSLISQMLKSRVRGGGVRSCRPGNWRHRADFQRCMPYVPASPLDWCLLFRRQPYGMHRGMLVHQGAAASVCHAATASFGLPAANMACRFRTGVVPAPLSVLRVTNP
jgi:hypothetical protein